MYEYQVGNLLTGEHWQVSAETAGLAVEKCMLDQGLKLSDFYPVLTKWGNYRVNCTDDRLVYGAIYRECKRIG